MKLSVWAKGIGVTYKTAWLWFKEGKVPGAYQLPSGAIIVEERLRGSTASGVAIYARVSSSENKANLGYQAKRAQEYAMAHGWEIKHIVKEVGSGVNDARPKLSSLLNRNDWGILLVEHKDRLTRFGFNYINMWLIGQNRRIEVINESSDEKEGIIQDFTAVIYSFAAKLYGLRRAKRKAEKIAQELQSDEAEPKD